MGDDPYDFEIALPAASNSATRSTRNRRSKSGSDDDARDTSGGLSSMSGISSEDESEQGTDYEQRDRAESNFSRVSKSVKEPKFAAAAASSSGSALDKAKSFLSKYSGSRSNPAASSRLRMDLDDDDDDFSVESPSSDDETGKVAPPTKLTSVPVVNEQDSASLQSSEWHSVHEKSHERDANHSEDVNGESSQYSSESPAHTTHLVAVPAIATRDDECSSNGSELGDSIESFQSGASVAAAEVPKITVPNPDYRDHEDSGDAYDDSFQEESLGLSQNNSVVDHKADLQPSLGAPSFTSARVDQSAASESGVYEEEMFEEESTVAVPSPAISSSVIRDNHVQQEDSSSSQNSSSYLDDEEPSLPNLPDNSPTADTPQTKLHSSLGTSARIVGETLESENGVYEEEAFEEDSMRAGPPHPVPSCSSEDDNARHEDTSPVRDNSGDESDGSVAPALNTPSAPAVQEKSDPPSEVELEDVAPPTRPRVTIVRAFELDEERRVEMRDASTQFTGNHAAIQTDLVPDGMRNLFAASPAPAPPNRKDGVYQGEPEAACGQRDLPPPPPPPPVASTFGSSMYSLDALKVPMTASTSIYKQQLLALQEQILQKKRETERIVQDRISFQYTSLRGTERFLAARRAQKLELWEALMRVDPTLDEQKAREVARLAQAAST